MAETAKITWDDSTTVGVTNHKIYRDDVSIGIVGLGVELYYDTNTVAGATYKYEVQAIDSVGESIEEVDNVNVFYISIPGVAFGIISYNISEETNTTAKVQVYMTAQCSINYYVNGVKNAASSDDFDASEIGPDEFRHTRTLTDLPAGQTSNLIIELTAESNLQVIQSDEIPLTTTGSSENLTPIMTNFRVEDATPTHVHFDAPLGPVTGLTTQGFTVSGKAVTNINTLIGYIEVDTPFDSWDNNTIRLESGDGTVHDFTMEPIANNIPAPTHSRLRYVSVSGSGSGDGSSQSNEWTFAEALSNSVAGDKVYLRKGNYGAGQFDISTSGTEANPITFEGYDLAPGDNPSLTMDGEITFDENVMPLFDGGGTGVSSRIINGSSKNYIIWKNIQLQNKLILMEFGGTSGNIVVDNCYFRWAGSVGLNVSGSYAQNKDCKVINSYFSNCTGLMYRTYGSSTLIDSNYFYQGNSGGVTYTDYYISIYGGVAGAGNNVITNNHVEVDPTASGGSRHGISIKASGGISIYNLIKGNTVLGQKPGLEIRHDDIEYNVCKNNFVDGNGVSDTTGIEFRGGAANNITEYNTISNVSNGIRYGNGETSTSDPSSTNNVVSNSTFENLGSCIQTAYRADKTSALSQYNKIQNCTFLNATQMFELTDNIPMDDTNLIENSIFDDVGNLYNVTTYNNGAIPYAFTFSYSDIWACGARGDNSSPGVITDSDNWITPTGTGVFEINPQLDANLQPQATFTDIDVPKITGINYDRDGNERQDPTTVGGVLSAEETPGVVVPTITVSNTDGTADFSTVQAAVDSGLAPGDIVGLKGGDEFFENVTINVSGAVDNPITFTSYGTGQALIKGTEPVGIWSTSGGNIWEVSLGGKVAYQVLKNGVGTINGRFPKYQGDYASDNNFFEANQQVSQLTQEATGVQTEVIVAAIAPNTPQTGWIKVYYDGGLYDKPVAYTSWSGTTFTIPSTNFGTSSIGNNVDIAYRQMFYCDDLIGHADITGASCHLQQVPWDMKMRLIASFDSSNGEVVAASTYTSDISSGDLFFVNNNITLLQEQDEWFYDSAEDKLFMYSTSEPSGIEIASINDSGITINQNQSNIDIDNLAIRGFNESGVKAIGSSGLEIVNVNVTNCTIEYARDGAGYADYGDNINFTSNTMRNCMQYGVWHRCDNSTLSNNILFEIGVLKNQTWEQNNTCYGLSLNGADCFVENNVLDKLGYVGVDFHGANTYMRNNAVTDWCLTLHDGGAFYSFNGTDTVVSNSAGSSLIDNVCIGYVFTPQYANWFANGIYFDHRVNTILVTGNTIANTYGGFVFQDNHDITASGNTVYNTSDYSVLVTKTGNVTDPGFIHDVDISDNDVLILKRDFSPFIIFNTINAEYDFGTYNNNRYFNYYNYGIMAVRTSEISDDRGFGQAFKYDLPGFTTLTGQDANSTTNDVLWKDYTASNLGSELVVNGDFEGGTWNAGWTAQAGTFTQGVDNTNYGIFTATTASEGILKAPSFSVVDGTSYEVTFDAKVDSINWYNFKVIKDEEPFNALVNVDINIAQGWNTYSFTFTATETHSNFRMTSYAWMAMSPLSIDNVSVKEATIAAPEEKSFLAYNETNTAKDVSLPSGTWDSLDGTITNQTVTINIAAFSSEIMIKQ